MCPPLDKVLRAECCVEEVAFIAKQPFVDEELLACRPNDKRYRALPEPWSAIAVVSVIS